MCYCCRKLDFQWNLWRPRGWEAEFGLSRPLTASQGFGLSLSANQMTGNSVRSESPRPWEAVRGRERPNSASHPLGLSLLSCDLSEPIRGARPLTHTASHAHGLSRTRPLRSVSPKSDRPLTHTGRGNAFSREISQTGPRMTASPGVRERPIGLSAGVRERPIGLRARQCV